MLADGVHGQFIYVSPSTGILIAMFSTWPDALVGAAVVGSHGAMVIIEAIKITVQDPDI